MRAPAPSRTFPVAAEDRLRHALAVSPRVAPSRVALIVALAVAFAVALAGCSAIPHEKPALYATDGSASFEPDLYLAPGEILDQDLDLWVRDREVVRGTLDAAGVTERRQARSRYGAKKES